MSDILILGCGWLAKRMAESIPCPYWSEPIYNYEDVQKAINQHKPKAIISCVTNFNNNPGINEPLNTDEVELDKNLNDMIKIHSFLPVLFAEAAVRNSLKLVHISAGSLFNYDYNVNRPIQETARPDFFDTLYSRSRMYGESVIFCLGEAINALILRVRMPLDFIPHRLNLLDKLLSHNRIIDMPNSVTYVPDFLLALKHLIKIDAEGLYHVVNYGGLRYRELLEEYRTYFPQHSYAIVEPSELKQVRTNLILSTDKLEESGFKVRDIHEVLKECVEKYVAHIKG